MQSGIHAHGWSRQEAIDSLLAHSGSPREDVEQQVDYFIAAPAHALAYPVGVHEIERIRREAEQRLGARFDVRTFHDAVLRAGALPLPVLDQVIRSRTP